MCVCVSASVFCVRVCVWYCLTAVVSVHVYVRVRVWHCVTVVVHVSVCSGGDV